MIASPTTEKAVTSVGALDFPVARPSQILRSLNEQNWCKRHIRLNEGSPITQFCAVGRLADEGGFDWAAWDERHDEHSNAATFVRHTYGLKANQVKAVMYRNDVDDLDSVIEFLEQRGK
jgi:hypothetical protein